MTIQDALRYEAANRPQPNQLTTPEKDALTFEWEYAQYWESVRQIPETEVEDDFEQARRW